MQVTDAVRSLQRDLDDVFGPRLQSFVAYAADQTTSQPQAPTLAVVSGLTADDLRACAGRVAAWHDAGLATPLLLDAHEFDRSLDAFPFEFGAILADHVVVAGSNPFEGLRVDPADLRRACEIHSRSHLLHLREGYLETEGRGDALADLIARSTPALATLIRGVARLLHVANGTLPSATSAVERAAGLPAGSLAAVATRTPARPYASDEARRDFPFYLGAVERLTAFIDQWRG